MGLLLLGIIVFFVAAVVWGRKMDREMVEKNNIDERKVVNINWGSQYNIQYLFYPNLSFRDCFKKAIMQYEFEKEIEKNVGKLVFWDEQLLTSSQPYAYGLKFHLYVGLRGIRLKIVKPHLLPNLDEYERDVISNPIILSRKDSLDYADIRIIDKNNECRVFTLKDKSYYHIKTDSLDNNGNPVSSEERDAEKNRFLQLYLKVLDKVQDWQNKYTDKEIFNFLKQNCEKYSIDGKLRTLDEKYFAWFLDNKFPTECVDVIQYINKCLAQCSNYSDTNKELENISNSLAIKYNSMIKNLISMLPNAYLLYWGNLVRFIFNMSESFPLITDYTNRIIKEISKSNECELNVDNNLTRLVINIREIVYEDNNLQDCFRSQLLVCKIIFKSLVKFYWDKAVNEFNLSGGGYIEDYLKNDFIVHEDLINISILTYYSLFYNNKDISFFQDEFWHIHEMIEANMSQEKDKYIKNKLRSDIEEKNIKKPVLQMVDVDRMTGIDFEKLISYLFFAKGYKSTKTKASGDQGIDVIVEKDNQKIGIQCKRYSKNVTNKAIQEAVAGKAYYNLDRVMVITNSHFTDSAHALARINDVELWDREILSERIKTMGEIK